MREKITVICGPTASGKTRVSAGLAKILNAEIISADSMQIYTGLNIGTAKPTPEETAGVRNHLIDIIDIASLKDAADPAPFSVAEYLIKAGECARDILSRGKRVIICGGTGLYIDHFIRNTQFSAHSGDPEYRKKLEGLPCGELYNMLAGSDPESAANIHPNNKKRIIRALEILKLTGKPKSELDKLAYPEAPEYDFIKLALNFPDRAALYDRINRRVDLMLANGFLDEVRGLYADGLERIIRKIGAIGYVELLDYLNGVCGFDEAVGYIKQRTRNYAKRQLTWFRKDPATVWVDCTGDTGDIIKSCMAHIKI